MKCYDNIYDYILYIIRFEVKYLNLIFNIILFMLGCDDIKLNVILNEMPFCALFDILFGDYFSLPNIMKIYQQRSNLFLLSSFIAHISLEVY